MALLPPPPKRSQVVMEVTESALRFQEPDSQLYNLAVMLAEECPELQVYAERQPGILTQTIMQVKPGISTLDAIKIGSYFLPKQDGSSALARTWRFLVSSSDNEELQYNSSHSYQNKGVHAKTCHFDPTLPRCVEKPTLPWTQQVWDEILSIGSSLEDTMRALTEAADLKGCFFELVVTAGTIHTVGIHKPDVILKLKGYPLHLCEALAAIINLQTSSNGCYDNDMDVGKMIAMAQTFLAQSGPERKSLVVGVSNLQMIRFFRVTRASSKDLLSLTSSSGFTITRDEPTSNLREVLSAYLQAHPATLDVCVPLNWQSLLPPGWKLMNPLGHGRTSTVHLVCGDQDKYAVKVSREGYMLDEDLKFLNQLAGIEGIPKVHTVLSPSVLVLQPVGEPFTRATMDQYGSLLRLGDLVDILECAHKRRILNRDVRQENIMVARSISNGELRLFILDWGFAANAGTVRSFSGSLTTASDSILGQYLGQGKEECDYTFADDLVSLVRCVFLFYNRRAASNMHKLPRDCESLLQFWESVMKNEFWARAQGLALKLDYTKLKKSLHPLQALGD